MMIARTGFPLACILCGLAACGPDGGPQDVGPAPDPILGIWDDPATTSAAEFEAGGRILDLGVPDSRNTWKRLEDGTYELEFGRPDGDGPPFVTTATLEGDLLRLDTEAVVTFRRRTWSPDPTGDASSGLEGKLIKVMTMPAPGRRISFSSEYLDLDNGESADLRFRGGWVLVRFDGTRMSSARERVPLQLGRRYRARGPVYTFAEFAEELGRLGHEDVSIRRPQNCTLLVEVHELVELEEVDPLEPERPVPAPAEPD